ncbi:class I SAM-dependent methyltransferase [Streptomyces pseudovenezuelae]|uniref:class I SAM-dependent methyltransferase n=1 Tax=Streptomyces pseudovenezuelae TaxID=67350 RepID=UPI0036EFC64D
MNQLLLNQLLVKAGVEEAGNVLDIGCGTGDLAVKLAQRGYEVTGIDLSNVAVDRAAERSKEAGASERTTFFVCDIENPAEAKRFDAQHFDLITCKLVYAFIEDRPAFLEWVKTHLAEGGKLLLICPVIHDGMPLTPRIKNISVPYDTLRQELEAAFTTVDEMYTEYAEDWGDSRFFILSRQGVN